MGMIKSEMEFGVNRRSLRDTVETVETEVEDSGAEELDIRSSGLDRMKDRIQGAVSTGFMEGFEGSRLDQLAGGVLGGAAGSALPGRLGPPGAAAGATKGADVGVSGIVESIGGGNPIQATLGVIAAGVTTLARASPAFGAIFDILSTAVNLVLMPIGNAIAQHLMPFAMKGLEMAQNFNNLVSGKGLSVALAQVVLESIKALPGALTNLYGLMLSLPARIWQVSLGFLAQVLEQAGLTGAANILRTISNQAGMLATSLQNLPGDIWNQVKQLGGDIRSLPEQIWGRMQALPRQIGAIIADTVPGIDDIPGSDVVGGAVNRGRDIIGLASGGIVPGPTPAVVGEAGPEAVIPLDRFSEVIDVQVDLDATDIENKLSEMVRLLRQIKNQEPVEISDNPKRDRGNKLL